MSFFLLLTFGGYSEAQKIVIYVVKIHLFGRVFNLFTLKMVNVGQPWRMFTLSDCFLVYHSEH